MKKNILSNFYQVENYGTRRHVVRLYESQGKFYVTFKYTSMSKFSTYEFGTNELKARLSYIQKVLFLLS